MLQTTILLGGLVTAAQVAALHSAPELLPRVTQPAINCGRYPTKGPSDHTVYTGPDGKTFEITCFAYKGGGLWREQAGSFPRMESCIAVCSAGQALPGCNAIAWNGGNCHLNVVTEDDLAGQDYPSSYSGANIRAQPHALNCKDGSSNGTIFTPSGSSQKYQVLCNYQYSGDTLGPSKYTDTLEQCINYCDTTAGCLDAIWSDAKYCWLKKTKTNGYDSGGWHSMVKVIQPASDTVTPPNSINCVDGSADGTTFYGPSGAQYDIKCNFQYDGANLGASKYTETFELCAELCDSTSGCLEGIWSSAKYCFLKSSVKGNGYKSSGWYSAVRK